MSSVVIRSEQLHRFQRQRDPWQRPRSIEIQELHADASSLLDLQIRVNMELSTPGNPCRDRINQAVLHQGESFLLIYVASEQASKRAVELVSEDGKSRQNTVIKNRALKPEKDS